MAKRRPYDPAVKMCYRCRKVLPRSADYFYRNRYRPDGLSALCKECNKKTAKAWRSVPENRERDRVSSEEWNAANPERRRETQRTRWWRENERLKEQLRQRYRDTIRPRKQERRLRVLLHYSTGDEPACVCCGERAVEFLALDHIDGGGGQHRRSIRRSIFDWVIDNDFPSGFRVLCHNCNCARAYYGYCPHEAEQDGWQAKSA